MDLYTATVPQFVQLLDATLGVLRKAAAFCAERGVAEDAVIGARLADDMHPFAYQVKSTAVHSQGAIEGLRRGLFTPDMTTPPDSFAGLTERVTAARDFMRALSAEEVNGFEAARMRFEVAEIFMPFTGAGFLLSFSLPNFYFHATTGYALLRQLDVPVGKRDFIGQPQFAG